MGYQVLSYRVYRKNGHVYTSQWNELSVSCKTIKDLQELKDNLREAFKKKDPILHDDVEVEVDLYYKTL
jgi:hypothetical protein